MADAKTCHGRATLTPFTAGPSNEDIQ